MSVSEYPLFGIILTVLVAYVSMKLRDKINKPWANYMLISIVLIIAILLIFDIPYQHYALGGDMILKMLGPITVLLAVPLYQHHHTLKKYFLPVFIGVFSGSLASIVSVIVLAYFFDLNALVTQSLLVKSVTTPIAISTSKMIGGVIGLSVFSVVITGVFGAIIATFWFQLLGLRNPIAKGIALGVSAHAIGTARAFELGKIVGAMSALSIVLAGVSTIFWLWIGLQIL
ncbi:MAG TPA: LrgB family protein [Helicobacteraceae bacterium]|nr:LrgB family protein [Helicobacteraceae bacterium]